MEWADEPEEIGADVAIGGKGGEKGGGGSKSGDPGDGDGDGDPGPSTSGGGAVTSPSRAQIADLPAISEVEARSALLSLVTEHCCWGKAAARNMAISKIVSTSAFHVRRRSNFHLRLHLFFFSNCIISSFVYLQYEIQTFTEKRETSWAFMPHGGGEIDGPRLGVPAPRPWDIPAEPTDFFRSEVKVLQVPHTASVKTCHRCRGAGSLLCQECHGKGWVSPTNPNPSLSLSFTPHTIKRREF